MRRWVVVVAVVLAAACSTAETDTRSEAAGLPSTREEAEGHVWELEPRAGAGAAGTITLEIDGHRLDGTTPCGTYRALVTIEGEDMDIRRLRRPDGGCDPDEEQATTDYLDALDRTTSGEIDDDHLVLDAERTSLRFDDVGDP